MRAGWFVAVAVLLAVVRPAPVVAGEISARDLFFAGARLYEQGLFADALDQFDQALAADDSFCRAHYYITMCLLQDGGNEAIRRARNEAEAYRCCASEGEADDVEALMQQLPPLPGADGGVTEGGGGDTADGGGSDADDDGSGADDDEWGRRSSVDDGDETDEGEGSERSERSDRSDRSARSSRSATSDDDRARASLNSSTSTSTSTSVRQRRGVGAVMLGAGGAVGAVGFIISGTTYRNYYWEESPQVYFEARDRNIGGLVMGVVGASVSAVGLLVLVMPAPKTTAATLTPGPVTTVTWTFR